jgi:hypothetical protein
LKNRISAFSRHGISNSSSEKGKGVDDDCVRFTNTTDRGGEETAFVAYTGDTKQAIMPTASFSAVACVFLGVEDLVAGIGMTARLIYIHSKSEG